MCTVGVTLSINTHTSISQDVRGLSVTLALDRGRHTAKLFLFFGSDAANRPRANCSRILVRPLSGQRDKRSTTHVTLRRGLDSIIQDSERDSIVSIIVCFKDCQLTIARLASETV